MSKSDKHAGRPPVSVQRTLQSAEPAPAPSKRRPNKKALAAQRPHGKYRGLQTSRWVHSLRDGCFMKPVLDARYDAYYCPRCLIWLEDRCDPTAACAICTGRPSAKKLLRGAQ